jgi:hypothetical protein
MLRNTPGVFHSLKLMSRLSWIWRKRAENAWVRNLPLIILCALYLAIFGVTALLAGYSLAFGSNGLVLLNGENPCYWWHNSTTGLDNTEMASYWLAQRPLLQQANVYASQCYNISNGESQNGCTSHLPATSIGYTVNTNVACPFPNVTLCRQTSEGAVRITSDLINSNSHLGINAPLKDQIGFRQIMTCSPILDDIDTKFATDETTTVFGTGHPFYVNQRIFNYSSTSSPNAVLTATWTNAPTQPPYAIAATQWLSNNTVPSEQPPFPLIPELIPDLSDISVAILTSNVNFSGPTNASLFSAPCTNITAGCPSRPFAAIGCANQYQLCNPVNNQCTTPAGWWDIGYADDAALRFRLWNDVGLSDLQHGAIYNIQRASSYSSLPNLFSAVGANAIWAGRGLLSPTTQLSLPPDIDDTVKEYEFWFSNMMAAIQMEFVQLANTPGSQNLTAALNAAGEGPLCSRQKVRDATHTSISLAGLIIIIVICSVVIILSLFIPQILFFVQRRIDPHATGPGSWHRDSVFQIQRKCFQFQSVMVTNIFPGSAFESRHLGTWSPNRSTEKTDFPITSPFDKWAWPHNEPRSKSGLESMTTAPVAIVTSTSTPSPSPGPGPGPGPTIFARGPSPARGRLSPYAHSHSYSRGPSPLSRGSSPLSRGPSPIGPPAVWQAPSLAGRGRPVRPQRPPSLDLNIEDTDVIHAISTDIRESRYRPVLGDFGRHGSSPLRLSPVRPEDMPDWGRHRGSWRQSVYKSGGSF